MVDKESLPEPSALTQIIIGIAAIASAGLNFRFRAEADDALRGIMYRMIFWRRPTSDSVIRDDREERGLYYYLTTVGGTVFLLVVGVLAIGRGLLRLL